MRLVQLAQLVHLVDALSPGLVEIESPADAVDATRIL